MLLLIIGTLYLQHTAVGQALSSIDETITQRKGTLSHIIVRPIDSTSTTITSEIFLINNNRDTVRAKLRQPKSTQNKFPLAILVVGLETGKEVVDMIEGYNNVILFAMDYPLKTELDFHGWSAFTTLFALRTSSYKTIAHLMLSLDWLSQLPMVDTSDITVVPVSFGVFTGVPFATIDKRVDRLAVVQAGGDIFTVIEANAERLGIGIPSWLAGWLTTQILSPFEPNDYIAEFSPRPLLIVSGESDVLFPCASVQSLFDHAQEPKKWIIHKSKHVHPDDTDLIKELANEVARMLYGKN